MNDSSSPHGSIVIDLRNPILAAVLAWLIPGAGHIYQRRVGKGVLFAVCILATYFFGLSLGHGRVVYYQWKPEDRRWQYVFQAAVGLPALPALVQARRGPQIDDQGVKQWMTQPHVVRENETDQLAQWHLDLRWRFELATLYTMIAGLLNVLAIYDAYGGPFIAVPPEPTESKRKTK